MSVNKEFITKSCCICANHEGGAKLSEVSDCFNEKHITKLILYVPEVAWQENWVICSECTHILNVIHEFRSQCIRANVNRTKLDDCCDDIKADDPVLLINEFICYHCSKKFNTKTLLIKHLKNRHCKTGESLPSDTKENEVVTKKQRTRVTKFTCEFCPEVLKTSKKYREHAANAHAKQPHEIKPFECVKCCRRFASSSNLVQHNKYHAGNRTNMCSYCGKGFITTSDLINHEKQHLNKREYKCEACAKGFNTHKDLRSHKIIKHKDPSTWNYHCTMCDKRFHIKPNYDNHMRRHMGDKRFTCKMCEKLFVTKDELRKHTVSHTNIRAFRCQHCEKEYKDKRVLDIHLAKVHGIGNAKVPVRVKRHFCSVCPKAFYDRNKLSRHMCTHSGERPFACRLCQKKFTDKSYVKQHLKTAHNVFDEECGYFVFSG